MELISKVWEYVTSTACFVMQNYQGAKPSEKNTKIISDIYDEMTTSYVDSTHEWMLKALFYQSGLRGQYEPRGDHWGDLGFQRDDPVSDLRGGGVLALKNLVYFLKKEPELAMGIIEKRRNKESDNYPWAVAGFNITRMVAVLFEVIQTHGLRVETHSRRTYWQMLDESDAFDRLYVCAFLLLDSTFDELSAKYMDFPRVIEATKSKFKFIVETSKSVNDVEHRINGRSTRCHEYLGFDAV